MSLLERQVVVRVRVMAASSQPGHALPQHGGGPPPERTGALWREQQEHQAGERKRREVQAPVNPSDAQVVSLVWVRAVAPRIPVTVDAQAHFN